MDEGAVKHRNKTIGAAGANINPDLAIVDTNSLIRLALVPEVVNSSFGVVESHVPERKLLVS